MAANRPAHLAATADRFGRAAADRRAAGSSDPAAGPGAACASSPPRPRACWPQRHPCGCGAARGRTPRWPAGTARPSRARCRGCNARRRCRCPRAVAPRARSRPSGTPGSRPACANARPGRAVATGRRPAPSATAAPRTAAAPPGRRGDGTRTARAASTAATTSSRRPARCGPARLVRTRHWRPPGLARRAHRDRRCRRSVRCNGPRPGWRAHAAMRRRAARPRSRHPGPGNSPRPRCPVQWPTRGNPPPVRWPPPCARHRRRGRSAAGSRRARSRPGAAASPTTRSRGRRAGRRPASRPARARRGTARRWRHRRSAAQR